MTLGELRTRLDLIGRENDEHHVCWNENGYLVSFGAAYLVMSDNGKNEFNCVVLDAYPPMPTLTEQGPAVKLSDLVGEIPTAPPA